MSKFPMIKSFKPRALSSRIITKYSNLCKNEIIKKIVGNFETYLLIVQDRAKIFYRINLKY